MYDLRNGEGLHVHVGRKAPDARDHRPYRIVGKRRVFPTHDVYLGGAFFDGLPRLGQDLLHRQGVGPRLAFIPRESAEATPVPAHVGVVDVAVDHEVDIVAHLLPARPVGKPSDTQKIGGLEQGYPIGGRETLTLSYLLFDDGKRINARAGGHTRSLAQRRGASGRVPPAPFSTPPFAPPRRPARAATPARGARR